VRVGVNTVNSFSRPLLSAPDLTESEKKELFTGVLLESRKELVGLSLVPLLPSGESSGKPTWVGNVLTLGEFAIDIELLARRRSDAVFRELVDEALSLVLESGQGRYAPFSS
jgi:hypothetical protein